MVFGWGILEMSKQKRIRDEDIANNLFVTVGRIRDSRKGNCTYVYFFEGKKYTGYCSSSGYNGTTSIVRKCFKVELSKKNPQYSNLIIEEEITDSATIANSGFRRKKLSEILNAK